MSLETFPDDWTRALCVAAHPDDLEYGTAMAVARWTGEGKTVAYVLATSGEAGIDGIEPARCGPLREAEERAGATEVGVDSVDFLGFPDGVLEGGLELRRAIARAVRQHRPEVVITLNHRITFGGRSFNMADHRVLGLAVLDACRDAGNRWIFPELADEGLEPCQVRLVALAGSPEPTHGVAVGVKHVEAGVRSLEAHAEYLKGLGGGMDPEAFLTQQAVAAGRQLGRAHGVSFEVYEL